MSRLLVALLALASCASHVAYSTADAAADVGSAATPAMFDVLIDLVDLGTDDDADRFGDLLDRVLGDAVETVATDADLDIVAASVTADGLDALRSLGVVESIGEARRFELALADSVPAIGAADLHAAGSTGAGREIVVIDTGVESDLPGVVLAAEACFVFEDSGDCPGETGLGVAAPCAAPELEIECRHGSHIASIITADGPVAGGLAVGVAPASEIIAIRVARVVDDTLSISESSVLQALEHAVDLTATHDIAAVNLSLGISRAEGEPCLGGAFDDRWIRLVDELEQAGVAVVAASANLSPTEDWEHAPVSFPACMPGVVAVGSSSDGGEVSGFTKSDATLDLLAPGQCIDSDVFDDPPGACPTTSGTSFATPHVSAAFALLDEAKSSFPPARLASLLRTTGELITRPTVDPDDRDPRYAEVRLPRVVDFVPFADTVGDAFWHAASDWALDRGISSGLDGVNFGAAGTLTRAQAVTLLWRFMGAPTGHPSAGFDDVPAGSFYALAVDWAKSTGVTTGITPTSFDPAQAVTRGQVAAFLWRMVGFPTVDHDGEFVDVAMGDFFAAAVDWMDLHTITTGTAPGVFSPYWVIDRGQIITFLFRLAKAPGAWTGGVAPPDDKVLF